jgi:hypothetical protein
VGATVCFITPNNDVWFSFIALGTDVNIRIVGNTSGINPGGTLRNPEVAIYSGTCTAMTELGCRSDAMNFNIIELYEGGLTIGQTYYIRVDGRNSAVGTFQLCVNNYNPVPSPSGDCPSGVILCDKAPSVLVALRVQVV